MKTKKQTTCPAVKLTGPELLRAAVNQIIEHPETWNQRSWHCGTSHCVAGWCNVLAGNGTVEGNSVLIREVGISPGEAEWLSQPHRSLPDIYNFAKKVLSNRDGFNRDGFDRAGFDRDGFDRDGFDRAGFDRDGFDRDGFNRAGFNRDGFDRAGFDRDGFDRDGFNRAGFNRDGFNRDGFNRAGFNRDGFDRDGFDRDGFDRDGFNRAGFNRDGKKLPLL
jgi:hypothetical protein